MKSGLFWVLVVAGCEAGQSAASGDASASPGDVTTAAVDANTSTDEVPEAPSQVVPLEVQDHHALNVGAVGQLDPAGGLRFEGRVDYAVGDGYPTQITQQAAAERWTGCHPAALGGEYTLLDVSPTAETEAAGDPPIEAARDAAGDLQVTVHGEGSATFVLHGRYVVDAERSECGFAPGSTVSVTDVMTLRAVRPSGLAVRVGECDAQTGMLLGAGRSAMLWDGVIRVAAGVPFAPQLGVLDPEGAWFTPWNVNWRHPARLEIRASGAIPAPTLSKPEGQRCGGDVTLVAPAEPGWLELVAPFGPATRLEVVGPDAVQARVEFGVMRKTWSPWAADAPPALASWEWVQAVVHEVTAGQGPLCAPPNAAWFRLESLSPDVCVVRDAAAPGPYGAASYGLAGGAEVVHEGECHLRVSAPDLDGGQGLSSEFTAALSLR